MKTAGGSSSVRRARVEERRDGAQPLEHGGRAIGAGAVPPSEHGVETLKEMAEPEARVPDVGTLVLQPEDGVAQLAQERGAIDLALDVVHVQLLDRARDRAKRGHVRPDGLLVEAAETSVVRHQAGGTRRPRVEVILEVQVGLTEIVYCGHYAPLAVTSE